MVQLTARRRIGTVQAGFAVGAGVLGIALGAGLVLRADSGFGRAWASAFVLFGLLSILGAVVARDAPVPGSARARAIGATTLALLGGWAALTAVVGAVEESWLWGVLLGVPAAYCLVQAARVWRSAPRTRGASPSRRP